MDIKSEICRCDSYWLLMLSNICNVFNKLKNFISSAVR